MLLCLLATAQAATPMRTTPAAAKPQLLPAEAWDRIRTGRVHVERDFIDATLAQRLRADALHVRCAALTGPVRGLCKNGYIPAHARVPACAESAHEQHDCAAHSGRATARVALRANIRRYPRYYIHIGSHEIRAGLRAWQA